MIWKFPCSYLLGKEDHICSIFVIFPTVFKKKGWKSSIFFFDPIINVQVISIPTEATGNESQLIKVRLQPGGAGGTHTQGQLRSAPPPHQAPDLILSVSVELGSPRATRHSADLEDEPSPHPPPHQSSHCDGVCSCTTGQRRPPVSRPMPQRKRSPLNVLRGLCPGCSDVGMRDKVLDTHRLSRCGQLCQTAIRHTWWFTISE